LPAVAMWNATCYTHRQGGGHENSRSASLVQ
jgi:hypothetical protein